MNRRLIYFIIIGLIILLGLAGLLFYFANKQKQPTIATLGPLKITKVLDEAVISPVPAFNNSSIWYFNSEGRLFKANIDGSNLSEFPLPSLSAGSLTSALWPKTGSDFITFSQVNGQVLKSYYDSTNKVFINLTSNVQWLDWLPDGKRVIYIWQTGDKKSQQLVMANPDGTGFHSIASVFWPDLAVKAGADDSIALMYRTAISGDTNKIYAINLTDGQMTTLVDLGKNLGATWLPSGNAFLFEQVSIAGSSKIYLYVMASHQVADLNLTTTLNKTVVDASSKTLYAAVAKPGNAGDTFIKIDLTTGKQTSYFDPDTNVKVKNLMLVGNTVYYIDSSDNKLYMISN